MSSYSELIKNFEKIRAYMRDFYVYGFKSRDEYDKKSARSYDDERRRIESWLGDHMSFLRTHEGKNIFISVDSRISRHNPFYKAWKTKSFTDGDITLHFVLFDILHSPEIARSIDELMQIIDERCLSAFDEPMMFDESTLRKKLKEYAAEGIIVCEKKGRKSYYRRASSPALPSKLDALDFYSEIAPCGVIGSFLLDKEDAHEDCFTFKHHYITSAIDSDVLASLFSAMRQKCAVTFLNHSRRSDLTTENRVVPLRVFISVQSGRQHLIAYQPDFNCIKSFRLDYISDVKLREPAPRFDELRAELDRMSAKMWGVACRRDRMGDATEHVEFTVQIEKGEEHIVSRLEREKRIGKVEQVDDHTYRFSADVYDTNELLPWIRTFICRITQLNFTNRTLENRLKNDIREMYRIYGIEGGDEK